MTSPSRCTGDGEDGSEHICRDAHRVVDGRGVEIDIGIEPLALAHDGRDAFAHADPLGFAELITEDDRHFAKVRSARIEDLVNAMADAHDFFLLLERIFNPGVDIFLTADFLEHVDHAFIRAAVERALEGSDRRGDGGIHIREGGDGDAGREGRGIHAVVSMKDVSDIERTRGLGCRRDAIEEVEKMGGLTEIGADGGKFETLASAVKISGDDADLGRDADSAIVVGGGAFVLRIFVVETEHRNGRANHIHRTGLLWNGTEEIDNLCGKFAGGAELEGERFELRTGW